MVYQSIGVYRTSQVVPAVPGTLLPTCSFKVPTCTLYWTSGPTSSLCWARVLTIGLVLRTEAAEAAKGAVRESAVAPRWLSSKFVSVFNSKFQVQHVQIVFKLSGPRTPRHGVHLARRPCRFPGQKRAETLCWWLPLPRSVSNKTLTCFSNKRPEVVKSRCPVPKCSIKLWHKQTTTCFCSHILEEKMVQHVPMYYAYVYVYVHVYLYAQYIYIQHISLESYARSI